MNNPLAILNELWNKEKGHSDLSPELIEGFDELFKVLLKKISLGEVTQPIGEYTGDTLMPWGKHKGIALKELPEGYCNWLYDLGHELKDKKLYAWLHGDSEQLGPDDEPTD